MVDKTATRYSIPDHLDVSRISAVSEFFESGVRAMIVAGAKWLDMNPDSEPKFGQINGTSPSVLTSVNSAGSLLHFEMVKQSPKGTTGEMIRIAVNNVRAILILGWDQYIADLESGRWF